MRVLVFTFLFIYFSCVSYANRKEPDKLLAKDAPRHFRLFTDSDDKALHVIGSGQFGMAWLNQHISLLPHEWVMIDLRQEPHGFLNGVPYTWYTGHDVENQYLPDSLIEIKERLWLSSLEGRGDFKGAMTEREFLINLGIPYYRFPIQDHMPPDASALTQFLSDLKRRHPHAWLYFHCRAGVGRTTTLLTIMDILHHHNRDSFETILARQAAIGGKDFRAFFPARSYKYPLAVWRYHFLRNFYERSDLKRLTSLISAESHG